MFARAAPTTGGRCTGPAGDRDAVQDAAGAVGGGQVSLALRPQKGKPGAQSTSYFGTLSADSTTISLHGVTNGVTNGVTIRLSR